MTHKRDLWPTYWHSPAPFDERLWAHMQADVEQIRVIKAKLSYTENLLKQGLAAVSESKMMLEKWDSRVARFTAETY
jgi:hypothetical protein